MRRGLLILIFGSVISIALALLMGFAQLHLAAAGAPAPTLWSISTMFLFGLAATLTLFWQATATRRWKGPYVAALEDIVDDLAEFDEADFTVFNNVRKMINAVPTIATLTTKRGSVYHHLYEKLSAVGLLERAPFSPQPATSIDPSVGYDLPLNAQAMFEEVILAGYAASLDRRGIVLALKEPLVAAA